MIEIRITLPPESPLIPELLRALAGQPEVTEVATVAPATNGDAAPMKRRGRPRKNPAPEPVERVPMAVVEEPAVEPAPVDEGLPIDELRAHLQKAIDTLGNDEVRRILHSFGERLSTLPPAKHRPFVEALAKARELVES